MTDRNAPCPCGSGKKQKKCCGQAAKAAATQAETVAATPGAAVRPADGSGTPAGATDRPDASADDMPFYRHTGRGLEAERTAADRTRHLRKRLQDSELRGTLTYNNGAFFKASRTGPSRGT